MKVSMGDRRLRLFADRATNITMACDTEFQGAHTLSIQLCVRMDHQLIIQLYRSPSIPDLPKTFDLRKFLPREIEKLAGDFIVRPARLIQQDLSPVRIISHVFNTKRIKAVEKRDGDAARETERIGKPISLTLAAHYWPADFYRIAGEGFFRELTGSTSSGGSPLVVDCRKTLAFRNASGPQGRFVAPVLEYARSNGVLHAVHVQTIDLTQPFGRGSLNDLAKLFLGTTKLAAIGAQELPRMLDTFRRTPDEAYGYAMLDSILTLLILERMKEEDSRVYVDLGIKAASTATFRPTQGSRVAETITRAIVDYAAGSVRLSTLGRLRKNGQPGAISRQRIETLMYQGSAQFLAEERLSKFGGQTGETHGGLLLNRSPTRFFHSAPGLLADVDMCSCYARILEDIKIYVGRPVVYEPGSRRMLLKEAIRFLKKHAAGRDAWFIKVTGDIERFPNALIPSTKDAWTHANYRRRVARQRAAARRKGRAIGGRSQSRDDDGRSALYSNRSEAGIVAWPTWLAICALPKPVRREYENLEVETIMFYPDQLVANSGPEFDRRMEQVASEQTPWSTTLDMRRLQKTLVEQLGEDHVALRFPIGELERKISELRQNARERFGKGSGVELTYKQHANTMYGVLASPLLSTNNVVAANVITATGRALAFFMHMSLDGIQVITDGCTYRRDQVPACSFAECLKRCPDYPINRQDFQGPFLPPEDIPQNDADFTAWYRRHVMRFFGVKGPEYERLFALHAQEHKTAGDPPQTRFDGLCCDGSANHVKLVEDGEGWRVVDIKARSYSKEAKEQLAPWLIDTYSHDSYVGQPPLVESGKLMTHKDAERVAHKALAVQVADRAAEPTNPSPLVYFPLGLAEQRVQTYKVIKLSQFVFRDPVQRKHYKRAMDKFVAKYGCGLELLTLRRKHGDRHQGSLEDLATALYQDIRSGGQNPTKAFNLSRTFRQLEQHRRMYMATLRNRRERLRTALYESINAHRLHPNARLTGRYLGQHEVSQSG
jgi:hypothetical protein